MSLRFIIPVISGGAIEPEPRDDTNESNQQAFLIIGDSIGRGTSEAPGPTPTAGTVYEYTTSIVQVGSSDLDIAGQGSAYPRMGIDYNASTGYKPVFINKASSGAEFSPNTDTNNYSPTGTLYALAVTAANDCLEAMGVSQLRGIIILLGINDARASDANSPLATVQTNVTSLFDRLQADFPDTPTYVINLGKTSSGFYATRIVAVRSYVEAEVAARDHCMMAYDLRNFEDFPEYYDADNLHLVQAGNNYLGEQLADFIEANYQ